MAEKWLQVRVNVHLLVFGVLVKVQSRTICDVSVFKFKLNCVVSTWQKKLCWQVDTMANKPQLGRSDELVVDLYARYFFSLEVKEYRIF